MSDYPTVKSQVKLATGKQSIVCETCGKPMSVTVGGVKRQNHRSFRPYKGTCRGCGTMYSAVINTHKWN